MKMNKKDRLLNPEQRVNIANGNEVYSTNFKHDVPQWAISLCEAQSQKTASQIIEVVEDWFKLSVQEIRIKYPDAYLLPDVRMSLVDYLKKRFEVN